MKVLIACEESQEVCKAFRALGHESYSCDLVECSGGHPEWHIVYDAKYAIDGGELLTQDWKAISIEKWDLMIAFPPCTYLSKVSNAFFNEEKYGDKARERKLLSKQAAQFFKVLYNAPIPKIAIENPVGFMNSWKRPTQIIQPWYFGDGVQKATCLWLRGLPRLNGNPDNSKPEPIRVREGKRNKNVTWSESLLSTIACHKERARVRSKTFPGIARAMAEQWGGNILKQQVA